MFVYSLVDEIQIMVKLIELVMTLSISRVELYSDVLMYIRSSSSVWENLLVSPFL